IPEYARVSGSTREDKSRCRRWNCGAARRLVGNHKAQGCPKTEKGESAEPDGNCCYCPRGGFGLGDQFHAGPRAEDVCREGMGERTPPEPAAQCVLRETGKVHGAIA